MSDCGIALRNATKEYYPGINIKDCWFHFTQRIWHQPKLGLVQTYNNNQEIFINIRETLNGHSLPPKFPNKTKV